MRGNGGIRACNENFCPELINYAVVTQQQHVVFIGRVRKNSAKEQVAFTSGIQ